MRQRHLGWSSLSLGSLALALLATAVDGQAPNPPVQPPAVQPAAAPIDQAIAWMHEAKRNYTAVKDYTCTLVSRENVRGKLKEENIMQMKFRAAPFSVYMRWLAPSEYKNQEVAYVDGKNKNQMRVHSKGLLKGAVGFISIDLNDPRVLEHSRHSITEAGIGNLIDQSLIGFANDKKQGRTETKIAEYEYNGRRCLRIENTRPQRLPGFYAHRSVLYIDKESKLPVRNENYDWPRPGGDPAGDMLEVYSYVDLRFNVGLTNREFDK